ncbi:MAG TPA: DUF1905 domain-containing protein [Candidatus Limnocylindria bacterium]|nr:DUF1905 domain-containing protein [Candidatus Limnocylindria bacterium]
MEPLFDDLPRIELAFRGPIIPWRGPSPFHFVEVPEAESREIEDLASLVTYGWGAIPATVRIGDTTWTTSLFPRKGRYLVPLRDAVRKAEGLELGDSVDVELVIQLRQLPPPDR